MKGESWRRRGSRLAIRLLSAMLLRSRLLQSEKGSVITGDGEIRRCRAVPVDWVGA
jgi:hypothetical protein